ncbi:unnamed protein product, partial [Vitis vinifera]
MGMPPKGSFLIFTKYHLLYIISFYFLFLDAELVSISIVFQANPSDPKTFPFILLGNKIDIDGGNSRVVSKKKAEDWCASKGNIPYFETSAKEDYNVDAAFLCIAKTALANEHEQDMDEKFRNVKSKNWELHRSNHPHASGCITKTASTTK